MIALLIKLWKPSTTNVTSSNVVVTTTFALSKNTSKIALLSVLSYPRMFIDPVWQSKEETETSIQPNVVTKRTVKLRTSTTICTCRILLQPWHALWTGRIKVAQLHLPPLLVG